ncbi:MAG: hypothetical protein JF616_15815 [Fibrobacteres bacterium]|nr:hypothetical protein [Fibrobacterota bacterium]
MMRRLPHRFLWALPLSAALLAACATAPATGPVGDSAPPSLDRALARTAAKGEWEKALRMADSAFATGKTSDREAAAYWKVVAWLYRDQPESAQALLEASQGKWAPGPRKVHAMLLLKLVRESCAAHALARARPEEAEAKPVASDRVLQERVESLERESTDLRTENQRLETEKQKYQKLLKDLETIR